MKASTLVLAGAALLSVSSSSMAGPPGPPPLMIGPTTDLTSFQVHSVINTPAAPPIVYGGGAIELDVGIHNQLGTEQAGVTVTVTGPGTNLSQTVSVAAKTSKTLVFNDAAGLPSLCGPKKYVVTIASSAGTRTLPAEVTPSCKFSSTVDDPWNHIEPDRVQDIEKGSLYFTNATVVASSCAEGIKIKGTIVNHTSIAGPSLLVQGSAASVVKINTAAAFPLAAGEGKAITLTPYGAHEFPDHLEIAIVDWQKKFGSKLVNQGVTVTTSRHCTVAGAWVKAEAAATLAPLPPRP